MPICQAVDPGQHRGGAREQGASRETTCLLGQCRGGEPRPGERGVRNGDAIDAVGKQALGDRRQVSLGDVWRELDHDRYAGRASVDALLACGHHALEQLVQRGGRLKIAQARRVRR